MLGVFKNNKHMIELQIGTDYMYIFQVINKLK